MLVRLHMLERLADLRKRIDLVDRQLQLAGFHCAPDVFADFVEDLADFLHGAGAEGDADILDAARGVQVEVEVAVGAAEAADIDDAALDLGGPQTALSRRSKRAPSSQIVEVFRRKLEGGRKHIILQVIDGSCAWDRQHDR